MRSLMTIFNALLANIAMLVHAVVPYHHHNKVFAAVVNLLDENAQQTFNHAHQQGRHFQFASTRVLVVQSLQETIGRIV